MNRLSSVLAGAITTAISGATLAAAAVGQGVFDQGPGKAKTQETNAAEAVQQATWTPEATEEAAAAPAQRVIYVEKEPVVITKEVRVAAQAPASQPQATQTASSPAATAAPDPTKGTAPTNPPTPVAQALASVPPPVQAAAPSAPPTQAAAAPTQPPKQATPVKPASGGEKEEKKPEPQHETEHEEDDD